MSKLRVSTFILCLLLISAGCSKKEPTPYTKKHRVELVAEEISKPPEVDIGSALCRQYDFTPKGGGETLTRVYLRLAYADRVSAKRKLRIRLEVDTPSYAYSGYVPELAANLSANPALGGEGYAESESPVSSADANFHLFSPDRGNLKFAPPDDLHIPETMTSCRYEITEVSAK